MIFLTINNVMFEKPSNFSTISHPQIVFADSIIGYSNQFIYRGTIYWFLEILKKVYVDG